MMPTDPWFLAALGGLFGLLVGSFLNVVIHRLPLMMQRQWQAEYAQWASEQQGAARDAGTAPPPADPQPPLTLSQPPSRCPHCGHAIRWYENVPVFSWLALRGRCSRCRTPIGLRYPLVELACAALFAWCTQRWGITATAAAWCLFSAALLSLALIDWDTTLLPDDITLPLLWAGLLAAACGYTATSLPDAVWGAAAGYLSLWLVYWGFKLITGKEGMGYGDFKLFAALGAWFGWQALVPLILLASLVGIVVALALRVKNRLRPGGYIPFGPFLAGAGFLGMLLDLEDLLHVLPLWGM